MADGNFYRHAVGTFAGELMSSCPGGLPAPAGTRHGRYFGVRKSRMHVFISAALDRTSWIVSVQRSH
jgi:hypothetical protein